MLGLLKKTFAHGVGSYGVIYAVVGADTVGEWGVGKRDRPWFSIGVARPLRDHAGLKYITDSGGKVSDSPVARMKRSEIRGYAAVSWIALRFIPATKSGLRDRHIGQTGLKYITESGGRVSEREW